MSSNPSRREFPGTAASTAAVGWAGGKLYAADASARPQPRPPGPGYSDTYYSRFSW